MKAKEHFEILTQVRKEIFKEKQEIKYLIGKYLSKLSKDSEAYKILTKLRRILK